MKKTLYFCGAVPKNRSFFENKIYGSNHLERGHPDRKK